MLQTLRELVERESPSDDKPRLDALADYLQGRFAGLAAEAAIISYEENGNGLRVVSPPQAATWSAPPALLLCHMDTVWPAGTRADRPVRVKEGRAYGPGAYDMKAGIVIVANLFTKSFQIPFRLVVKFRFDYGQLLGIILHQFLVGRIGHLVYIQQVIVTGNVLEQ